MTDEVRVGDVLDLQRRRVLPEQGESYREIGLRSFGKGVFHKKPTTASELGTKKVFRIEPGDFLISNVFAWEGAVAVASEGERGLIGSHRFMTWTPKRPGEVDVDYLRHYFGSDAGLAQLRRASPGSAGRNRTLGIAAFENGGSTPGSSRAATDCREPRSSRQPPDLAHNGERFWPPSADADTARVGPATRLLQLANGSRVRPLRRGQ